MPASAPPRARRTPAGSLVRLGARCGIAALVLSPSALLGCHERAAAETAAREPAPAVDVEATTPETVELPRTVRVTGTLYGDEEATIAAKVSGRVVAILADLGDRVEPGAPLLRIDPTDYELALAERRRALEEALARVGLTALPDEGMMDLDAVPSVQRAIAEAENARVLYERARGLAEASPPLMGPQEFSDIRTAYEVAQSEVAAERLNAGAILALARTLDVQVRIAEQRLADSEPRAPIPPNPRASDAGYVIAERMVSIGDFVQVGDPLFRLVDPDPIKLRLNVPERRFAAIRPDQPASVAIDAISSATPFAGRVSRVSPSLNIQTRTLPVEVLIPNPEGALKPGAFATADITVGASTALTVPASAVLTFAGVHKVIVIADGVAQERRVQLGDRVGDRYEILQGLDGSETIVLTPSSSLTTGARVRTVSGSPAPAPSPPSAP